MKLRLSKAFYFKHGTSLSPFPPIPYPLQPPKVLVATFQALGILDGKMVRSNLKATVRSTKLPFGSPQITIVTGS